MQLNIDTKTERVHSQAILLALITIFYNILEGVVSVYQTTLDLYHLISYPLSPLLSAPLYSSDIGIQRRIGGSLRSRHHSERQSYYTQRGRYLGLGRLS